MRTDVAVAFLSFVGLVASGSRAGVLAAALGGLVVVRGCGLRRAWVAARWLLLGVLVASVGVLVSADRTGMDPDASMHVAASTFAITVVLLGLGCAIAMRAPLDVRVVERGAASRLDSNGIGVRPMRGWNRVGVACASIIAGGLVLQTVRGGLASRLSLGSQDRADLWTAAWELAKDNLAFGYGIGRLPLTFARDGVVLSGNFVHNEWLEYFAQVGVVGFVGLIILVGAVSWMLHLARPARHESNDAHWIGAVAALLAFAVHSSFDFLWHSIALVGLAAILIGIAFASSSIDSHVRAITTSSKKGTK